MSTTPHLGLPLPDPTGMLEIDVIHIRTALQMLDEKLQMIDTLLTSDEISLDTVQEIVMAIKGAKTEIGAAMALVDDRIDQQSAEVASQLALLQSTLQINISAKEASVTAGHVAQYYRGDKSWADLGAGVRAVTLSGLSTATNAAIVAADTVIQALGKLQAQIGNKQDQLSAGNNIKTINGESPLGAGNIQIQSDSKSFGAF